MTYVYDDVYIIKKLTVNANNIYNYLISSILLIENVNNDSKIYANLFWGNFYIPGKFMMILLCNVMIVSVNVCL